MKRRNFLACGGLAATAWGLGSITRGETARKPNIVVIMTDDFAVDGIGTFGNPEVKTPHIDRLIARSVTFSQAHIQGSWSPAICIASRTMLMTGLPVWQARDAASGMAAAGLTWPQRMRAAGYRTLFTGKWHVHGIKPEAVFDRAINEKPGMPKDRKPDWYGRPVAGQPDPFRPADESEGGFWEGGRHWSEVQADDGIALFHEAVKDDSPVFMYLSFNAPHDPRQAPQAYLDMYPEGSVSLPRNFMPAHPLANAMGSPATLRDEALAPTPRTPYAVDVHRREYYAIISHLDAQIGRVLDAIEASGAADNTVIIFAADNGLAVGQHGLLGKQNMYDHSVRVPLAIAGPGLPRGERRDALVYMQDLTSTCLELAGATPFESTAYRSLMPAIRAPAAQGRAHLYAAYLDNARMVRDAAHKLVVIPSAAKVMLFDLARDPLEMNDLSEDPALRPVTRRLFAELLRQQTAAGDTLNLSGAFPDLASSDKGKP